MTAPHEKCGVSPRITQQPAGKAILAGPYSRRACLPSAEPPDPDNPGNEMPLTPSFYRLRNAITVAQHLTGEVT
jgi:hypothetical protein